jgi:hypothetical protein
VRTWAFVSDFSARHWASGSRAHLQSILDEDRGSVKRSSTVNTRIEASIPRSMTLRREPGARALAARWSTSVQA